MSSHNTRGNCTAVHRNEVPCGESMCDVCHEHDEPRGECPQCPPCVACDEDRADFAEADKTEAPNAK